MSRLVHAGSTVVDYVYRIDTLPAAGTEKTAARHDRLAGGGFNLMVAASRSGMEVAFAGRLGTGPDGDFLRAALDRQGIAILLPPAEGIDSGNCVVLVTDDAERTFVSWPGAEAQLDDRDLASLVLQPGDWVFTSGYTLSYPGSREALARWIESLHDAVPFVFDPTPVVAEIPPSILRRVLARTHWLSCNDREAQFIAGCGDIRANAAALLDQHCPLASGVVIRSGRDGAFVQLRGGEEEAIPGFAVEAVDTNGAGDTHIGAFVSALARGEEPFAAALYANAAAAISVTRHGGSAAPSHTETQAFLAARHRPAATTAA